ncbi:hypothetical protein SH661x_003196 [Planctomicrobium sp. SH661]|uniref:hypothetical protein n=1 Tax=Planctomicrobium sp. SH661 TaxID=3448124 RepID=UPI003F5B60F2
MLLNLTTILFYTGIAQLCVLIASALVPIRLQWSQTLSGLPVLVRQLFWVYGSYVVLSIVSLGLITATCAAELAGGSGLARAFCAYAACFWGIRLSLQPFLEAKPFLTTWWLRCGYPLLSVLFACFTLIFIWGAIHS